MRSDGRARVVFLCAAGPEIGGGHVMRSLTLARALERKGAACAFEAGPEVTPLLDRFAPEMARTSDAFGADAVVVDSYAAEAEGDRALAAGGAVVAAIDDLADRRREVALLIDPSFVREPDAYAGLLPDGARLLLGPEYALVRAEFGAARARALARRDGREARRGLVSLGLTDVGGVTGVAVDALAPAASGMVLDVVVGAAAPSLPALQRRGAAGLVLHVATTAMAELMTAADLAVGAGGGTAWERACLGLPAVTVILADNQRPQARVMDATGLTLAVERDGPDFEGRLRAAWSRLAGDAGLRTQMGARLAGLCDGRGAERAADALLALIRERRGG